MGLNLWGSSTSSPTPRISADGTPIAPDRSERARCWEARDAYFQCLDKNNILDSLKLKDAAAKKCGSESKQFDSNCATSWVEYFKQRRVAEFKKAQMMKKLEAEGATEVAVGQVTEN